MLPVAAIVCSGFMARQVIIPWAGLISAVFLPLSTSQSQTSAILLLKLYCPAEETNILPSAEKPTPVTGTEWPDKVFSTLPPSRLQRLMDLPVAPATVLPSGEN